MNFLKIYKNKKILITGHTGFKGSWLSIWLNYLGAKVYGISKSVPTNPSNYKICSIGGFVENHEYNIVNYDKFKKTISKIKPDFIFHLAAQALVKKSYNFPKSTFESNSIGTLNLLEALKVTKLKKKCSVIIITSDKSYKNLEIDRGYKENDLLGGYDPYSASKACAELIIQSYVKSFFKNNKYINIGVARAGNVIGGGDWSDNRLIPDCIRSINKKKILKIRNPKSTRPWQHVLEALSGYLILGENLHRGKLQNGEVFNFGPNTRKSVSVLEIINKLKKFLPKLKWKVEKNHKEFESKLLKLNSDKALRKLKWKSVLNNTETIDFVISWYLNFYSNRKNMFNFSIKQIELYSIIMKKRLKGKL